MKASKVTVLVSPFRTGPFSEVATVDAGVDCECEEDDKKCLTACVIDEYLDDIVDDLDDDELEKLHRGRYVKFKLHTSEGEYETKTTENPLYWKKLYEQCKSSKSQPTVSVAPDYQKELLDLKDQLHRCELEKTKMELQLEKCKEDLSECKGDLKECGEERNKCYALLVTIEKELEKNKDDNEGTKKLVETLSPTIQQLVKLPERYIEMMMEVEKMKHLSTVAKSLQRDNRDKLARSLLSSFFSLLQPESGVPDIAVGVGTKVEDTVTTVTNISEGTETSRKVNKKSSF